MRDDVTIMAICDIDQERIGLNLDLVEKSGKKKPAVFGKNEMDYKNLLELKDLDAVIIATPWLWHTRIAKDRILDHFYSRK